MKKPYKTSSEEIAKMREVISRTDNEEAILFTTYLIDLIKQRTGKAETLNRIASNCNLNYNDLSRFPIKKHAYLAKVCLTYNLSLNNSIELYYRSGLCLSYTYPEDEKYLNSVVSDRNNLPKEVNTESKVDCLLRLVKNHVYADSKNYDENEFRKTMRGIQEKIVNENTESERNGLFVEIINLLKKETAQYLWIMESGKDSLNNESRRYTVFEISFAAQFNKKETIELYRSFGYSLAPDQIKFDAFVSWLLDLKLGNIDYERYHLYKTVASDMDKVKVGAFHYSAPSPEGLDNLLKTMEYYEREDIEELIYNKEMEDNYL
ncbi:MAG: hypothetical protein K5669_11365 [Lachnospiraceae bacterium]|nr:hypothetical protein [Lachnospiraceae bacterium]